MSDKLRAAAQAALDWLKDEKLNCHTYIDDIQFDKDREKQAKDLEAALAEPAIKESLTVAEQKPMLEMNPQKREWVGLTDEEILQLYIEHAKYQEEGMKLSGWGKFAADVQAKLREKNT